VLIGIFPLNSYKSLRLNMKYHPASSIPEPFVEIVEAAGGAGRARTAAFDVAPAKFSQLSLTQLPSVLPYPA